jgi:MarR family
MGDPGERDGGWTLLTGHGHVLVEIARNPGARIRDISAAAGITERTVQAIVADLEAAGYLTRTRTGRRTRYTVNPDSSFRHPAQEGLRVGPLLAVLAASGDAAESGPAAGPPGGPTAAAPAHDDRAGPGTPGPGRSR